MPWEIFLACAQPDGGVDAETYALLHTTIDFDGLFDLIEIKEVQDSWKHAAIRDQMNQAHGQ